MVNFLQSYDPSQGIVPSSPLSNVNAVSTYTDIDLSRVSDPAQTLARQIASQQNFGYVIGNIARMVFDKVTGRYLSAFKRLSEDNNIPAVHLNNPAYAGIAEKITPPTIQKQAEISIAPKKDYLDRLIILGTDMEEEYKLVKKVKRQSQQKIAIIGNGRDIVSRKDLQRAAKKIGPGTIIDLMVHGETDKDKYFLFGIFDVMTIAGDVFKAIDKLIEKDAIPSDRISTIIRVCACKGEAAKKDIDKFRKGVGLIVFGLKTENTNKLAWLEGIPDMLSRPPLPVLQEYAKNVEEFAEKITLVARYKNKKLDYSTKPSSSILNTPARVSSYLWQSVANLTQSFFNLNIDGHKELLLKSKKREITDRQLDQYSLNQLHQFVIVNKRQEVAAFFATTNLHPNTLLLRGAALLFTACGSDQLEMAELLLQLGAKPDLARSNGDRSLGTVVAKKNSPIAALLLKHGANPNLARADGELPLIRAVVFKDIKTAELLLQYGADRNLPLPDGSLPLVCAIINSDMPMFKLLLKHGADASQVIHAGNKEGMSPIFVAILTKNKAMATVLLFEYNVNPFHKEIRGLTPREYANIYNNQYGANEAVRIDDDIIELLEKAEKRWRQKQKTSSSAKPSFADRAVPAKKPALAVVLCMSY